MNGAVKAYFASAPEERRAQLGALHDLITGLYPNATVDLQYKMPTYHAEEGWVAIAHQKNYVSFYTCGAHHLAKFKEKHPEIKTGKGCINFRLKDELPLSDIAQVVRHAMDRPKGRAP